MIRGLVPPAADRRRLPEGRIAGPMPLVIAIMMFLTALAAAGGLALARAAQGLGTDLVNRVTIQVIEADAASRADQADRLVAALRGRPEVAGIERVDAARLEAMLAPWLGDTGGIDAIPLPALIDLELRDGATRDWLAPLVRRAAPAARIERDATTLAPLTRLIASLRWLATVLVLLMSIATAFTVVLAARAALNTHRPTIDVMHLLGATDHQIARLFQRRIALDALYGALLGLAVALATLLLVGRQAAALGSELVGSVALGTADWAVLFALPLGAALLATAAARWTVVAALRQIL